MKSYRRRIQKPGPPHPGEILRDLYLEPLNMSVLEAAKQLDTTELKLYEFLRGKRNVTYPFADRLAIMFNTTAAFWINLQRNYDAVQDKGLT